MKRKITLFILALILTLTTLTPTAYAQRQDFADLPADHWVRPFLQTLERIELKAFHGVRQSDGTYHFQPNRNITRAEFSAIVVRAFDLYDADAPNPFNDVTDSAWYAPYVASAAAAGVVQGVNSAGTLFAPGDDLTRQQAFVMFARICMSFPFFPMPEIDAEEALARFRDAEELASWAFEETAFLAYHRLTTGVAYGMDADGNSIVYLHPQRNIRRSEVATLLSRVADRIRVEEIMSRPPNIPPSEPQPEFPEVTLEALGELIRRAAGYLEMQNNITTATFRELRDNHRRAVIVYEADRHWQSVTNQTYYELAQAIRDLVFLDKDALWEAYLYAAQFDHNVFYQFTPDSFNAMRGARTHARNIYNQTSITQADIDGALAALQNAVDNLVRVDKTALAAALYDSTPDSLRWFLYSQESFDVFQRARSAASLVYVRMMPQAEINAATEALIAAWNGLEQLPKEEFLLRIIRNGEVSERLEDRWTAESFATFMPALNAARSVLENGGTFDDHYAAAVALADAIQALVVTYRLQLPVYLRHARLYVDDARYTQASRTALQAAVDQAQAALDDADSSMDYLRDVRDGLRQAILGLERA
ncbi:MAG: S-layer homology domain-containing protein [Oscillospiraceae bacterium]|nr:S-layer homology domain-containing protein [Oscillospiraceae bacterium]